MSIPKYSKLEIERRWLVHSAYIESLKDNPYTLIEDLYLNCGRLRLRSMTNSITGQKIFKLCKKYGATSTYSEPITNIYLTEVEFKNLLSLEGLPLNKKRFKQVVNGCQFSIDVFEGNLEGLVLCEIEEENEEKIKSIEAPPFISLEVTSIAEYSGGLLCTLKREDLLKLLNKN